MPGLMKPIRGSTIDLLHIQWRFVPDLVTRGEKWLGHVLIGPSLEHNTFGIDLGVRLSYNVTERIRIFGAAVLTGHTTRQFSVVSGGLYEEPMSSLLFLNVQAGVAWNFTID